MIYCQSSRGFQEASELAQAHNLTIAGGLLNRVLQEVGQ